jgi:glycosyltransferase involved in cell wall biosynthesis
MANLVSRSLVAFGHDVTVIRSESEAFLSNETHDFPVPVVAWNDSAEVSHLLAESDAVIYQIGNHYAYHMGCMKWLPEFPGVVCLHDYFLSNLFFGWLEKNLPEAGIILNNWYGPEVARAFFNFKSGDELIENTRIASPLTEWVCSMATGVIAHSSWDIDRVINSCGGPVAVVPLAYDTHYKLDDVPSKISDHSRFRILTIGHVNFNKRAESVIAAIGSSTVLRDYAVYRMAGEIQPEIRQRLVSLAKELKVNLTISGQVSDHDLVEAIQEADVVSCLRFPVLESASASAIEAMLYGKPTMVTAAGFYDEIPDGFVMKVNPSNEIASIRTVLERLYQDQEFGIQMGKRAQEWALRTFSSDNYAEKLIDIADRANAGQPLLTMTKYFAKVVQEWGGSEEVLCLDETISPLGVF